MTERVMAVGAHPDDIEFGCGATLAKHVKAGDQVSVLALADGVGSRGFSRELVAARHGACRRACKILGTEDVWLFQFADNQMDTLPLLQVVQHIEKHLERFKPTIVYTHHGSDLNVDHTITHKAVRVACRPQPGQTVKRVYYFEIPCSSAWGGEFQPDYFIDVAGTMEQKIEAAKCYAEELREPPHPRSLAGIARLAELRGSRVGLHFAEAFKVGWEIS